MKFEVSRASEWFNEDSPCEGAYMELAQNSAGYPYMTWHREFNTLEELTEWVEDLDCKKIVLSPGRITIYDDWLE